MSVHTRSPPQEVGGGGWCLKSVFSIRTLQEEVQEEPLPFVVLVEPQSSPRGQYCQQAHFTDLPAKGRETEGV